MASSLVPVEQMMNVGPTVASRLREIGIHTSDDLHKVGSVTAYRQICECVGRTVPVCYYLYSLEGALRNKHWNSIGSRVKRRLLAEVRSE